MTWQAGRQSWEFARAWPLHWLHLEIAPRAVLQHHSSLNHARLRTPSRRACWLAERSHALPSCAPAGWHRPVPAASRSSGRRQHRSIALVHRQTQQGHVCVSATTTAPADFPPCHRATAPPRTAHTRPQHAACSRNDPITSTSATRPPPSSPEYASYRGPSTVREKQSEQAWCSITVLADCGTEPQTKRLTCISRLHCSGLMLLGIDTSCRAL